MDDVASTQTAPKGLLKWAPARRLKAAESWVDFFKQFSLIGCLLLLIVVGVLFNRMVHTIHYGEAGVLFLRLFGGTVSDYVLGEGLKIILPWDIIYIYDVKVQEREFDVDVLMTNGLTMHVGISVRFNVIRKDLGRLHKLVGPAYEKRILVPVISASVREVLGKYLPAELYSQKREALQLMVEERSRMGVSDKFINIDRLIIRGITMPKLINDSIESKLEQEQKYQEYVFRIEKEKAEAERKRIEAEGIQTYHNILAKSLSPEILEFEMIQMKRLLSQSGQERTIVMDLSTERGSGKPGGVPPVILNLNKEPGPSQEAGAVEKTQPGAAAKGAGADLKKGEKPAGLQKPER